MDNKQVFKKYYSRLATEGMIKALICGFIVGFAVSIIPAFISDLVNFNGLWLSIGIGLAAVAGATPLFYFYRFRPKTKQIAERIDRLGLDERLITMMELEKDDSYIALLQREDAKEKLKTVDYKQLKLSIFIFPIVLLIVLAVFSVRMTISAATVIPKIQWQYPEPEVPGPTENFLFIPISYVADVGGVILGEAEQVVIFGKDATTVVAVANIGYEFEKWSDGLESPERTDKNVQKEFTVYAIFAELVDGGDGNGPPIDGKNPGGEYIENNVIIDGETYYRDVYQNYYDEAMRILAEGGEIPPALREIIALYFGIII
jgi:hypothetical protein